MTAACARCQAPLAANVLEGLCPRCLLLPALERIEDAATTASAGFTAPGVAELARLFPQLEILELLGQGGMGAVYRARQIKLDRLVALKVLPPAVANDPGFAERFAREARALARLNHPHIVAVHDFGEVQGLYYLVMEFVDGVNLRQALSAGKLEPGQALKLVAELCAALQYAHEEGVVHRDVKPENVLLDRKGRVKVADFGLAKLVGPTQSAGRLTASRQAMGTPHYMAPEQWEKPLEVDHRADIYSLGVVFYELLTGELPLGRFPPPSQKAGVDARLDPVVLRAMEKQPEQRYQKMSELKTAVEGAGQEIAEGPSEGFRYGRKLRIATKVALVVVLVLTWFLLQTEKLVVNGFFDFAVAVASGGLLWIFLTAIVFALLVFAHLSSKEWDQAGAGGQANADESPDSVPALTAEERELRRLLSKEDGLSYYLSVHPDIDNTLLATARKQCRAAPDDRILAVLDFSDGEGTAALLFGGAALYWRNAEETPHPGPGSLSYAELSGRRIINHGDVVYLGNDQFLCPQPDDSGIDNEALATALYKVGHVMAPRPA
jgi:serine/threonine protein kinase